MGLIRTLFAMVGIERRLTIGLMMVAGAGLVLIAGYYANSGAPPKAQKTPEAPYDATGDLAVGSLNGEEAAAKNIEQVARKRAPIKKAKDQKADGANGNDEERSAGVMASAPEVEEAGEPQTPLQGLSEEPPPEQSKPGGGGNAGDAGDGGDEGNGGGAQASPDQPDQSAQPPASAPAQRPVPQQGGYKAPEDKTLYLTIPKMSRVQDTPAFDTAGDDEQALAAGSIHLRGTGFPWEDEANVYIAGHRLGYEGTGSHLIFYDMDVLGAGDEINVKDASGRSYTYRVYDTTVVGSDELTVANPASGKNVLTLQTCTLPDYSNRLLVHAERV